MAFDFMSIAVSCLLIAFSSERSVASDPTEQIRVDGPFRAAAAVDQYLRAADEMVIGKFIPGERGRGSLVVSDSKGSNRRIYFKTSGGFVRVKSGQAAIALLDKTKTDEMALHSFCGASGVFLYSAELEQHIKALRPPKQ